MLSANSSPNVRTECPLRDIRHIAKNELRSHQTWLFIFCSLFLLAEPFLFYLIGLNNYPNGGSWRIENAPLSVILKMDHMILLAPLTILAAVFLALTIFSFLHRKGQSDMVLSWPHSRGSLYFGKILAGMALMLALFLLNTLGTVMLLPNEAGVFLQESVRLALPALTLVVAFSLAAFLRGRFFHALALSILTQFVIPFTAFLGGWYAIGSIPGMFSEQMYDWIRGPLGSVMLVLSPALQLFDTRQDLCVWILRLLSLALYIALGWLLFNGRRAEIAGQHPEPGKGVSVSELFWLLASGLLGAFFFESIVNRMSFFVSFFGFAVFALASAFLLNQLKFRQTLARRALRYAGIALLVFTLFDLGLELYPSHDAGTWKAEDLAAVEVDLNHLAPYFGNQYPLIRRDSPLSKVSLRLEAKNDRDVIRKIMASPVKISNALERDGLIRRVSGWQPYMSQPYRFPELVKLFHVDGRQSYLRIGSDSSDYVRFGSDNVSRILYEWMEQKAEFQFLLNPLREMKSPEKIVLQYTFDRTADNGKFLQLIRAHKDFEILEYDAEMPNDLNSSRYLRLAVKGESKEKIFTQLKKRENITADQPAEPLIQRYSDEYIEKENGYYGLTFYAGADLWVIPAKTDIFLPETYIRGLNYRELRGELSVEGLHKWVSPTNDNAETWNLIFRILRDNAAEGADHETK